MNKTDIEYKTNTLHLYVASMILNVLGLLFLIPAYSSPQDPFLMWVAIIAIVAGTFLGVGALYRTLNVFLATSLIYIRTNRKDKSA